MKDSCSWPSPSSGRCSGCSGSPARTVANTGSRAGTEVAQVWTSASGTNQILVGASSRDIRLTGQIGAPPANHVITLRAHANNDYVTAENAGAAPLIANPTAIGPWEEFDLIND